jgi:hypothetical protein
MSTASWRDGEISRPSSRQEPAPDRFHRRSGTSRLRDFLHGSPPFYGSVSRDGARIHLRFVHEPAFVARIVDREHLIAACVDVDDIKSLYAE